MYVYQTAILLQKYLFVTGLLQKKLSFIISQIIKRRSDCISAHISTIDTIYHSVHFTNVIFSEYILKKN
jgi:hypothetical protein